MPSRLIIKFALSEAGRLGHIFGKPFCLVREVRKAILDCAGDRVQAHDFVILRLACAGYCRGYPGRTALDPLRSFSESCREELERLK